MPFEFADITDIFSGHVFILKTPEATASTSANAEHTKQSSLREQTTSIDAMQNAAAQVSNFL